MPVCKTELEVKLYEALRRISRYETPDRLRRSGEKQYGLPGEEVVELAYENIQEEARRAIKGVRLPKAVAT